MPSDLEIKTREVAPKALIIPTDEVDFVDGDVATWDADLGEWVPKQASGSGAAGAVPVVADKTDLPDPDAGQMSIGVEVLGVGSVMLWLFDGSDYFGWEGTA